MNHALVQRESEHASIFKIQEPIIELEIFLSLLVFGFIAAVTPGPNNVMLTATGLNFGIRRGIPHLLGICLGFGIMLILVGLGFGTLFKLYPVLHEMIKIVGVLYLLYLSWKIATTSSGPEAQEESRPMTFLQAAAFQWINPKAWVMGSSALAAFTSIEGNFPVQVLIVSITFVAITLPSAGVWLVFGASLQHFLKDPGNFRIFNICMALLLVASILPVIWDTIT